MLKKFLPFVIFIMVVFATIILLNTITFKSKQISVEEIVEREIKYSAIQHLAQAVKIKTITTGKRTVFDSASFSSFSQFIAATYPNVQKQLEETSINKYSHLYKWEGRNAQLKPVVLLAHIDVFPVPQDQLSKWTEAPFNGVINSGAIWGRGTMHGKLGVIGILESIEILLQEGFRPERTFYLAFGHDKIAGGLQGAKAIAQQMKKQGIVPEFVLDEGFAISRGLVPGLLMDVAQIGTAEVGFASLVLSIQLEEGNSFELTQKMAIKAIEHAIEKLRENPLPPEITKPVEQFLKFAGPEMRFRTKMLFANKLLFRSAILKIFQQSGDGSARVQSAVITSLRDIGIIEKESPSPLSSTVHYRILPGTDVESVIDHVKNIIKDERIHIQLKPIYNSNTLVSDVNTKGYSVIIRSIHEIFPYVICVPNLLAEATDGRHFNAICDNIYRFSPIKLNPENNLAFQGVNEHIQITEFKDVIRFYIRLIENS